MRITKLLSVFAVAGFFLASCDGLFEEREHVYEGPDLAEFDPVSATHTINAASQDAEVFGATVNLISAEGNAQSDLTVNFELVETDADSDQFDLDGESITISQDTVSTVLPITVNADNIDQGESFSITVQLVEGGDVDPEENHDTFTLEVEKEVELSGNIEDEDDEAISDIGVALGGSASGETATDEDGNFFFSVPAGGDYSITPLDPGIPDENGNGEQSAESHVANDTVLYFFDPESAVFAEVAEAQTDISFTGLDPVTISGNITEEDAGPGIFENDNGENPWDGVTVTIYDVSGDDPAEFATVTPNADGDYQVAVKPYVDYAVIPTADNFVFDPEEATFDEIGDDETADFEASPVVNLDGVITDADTGDPVAGVEVEISSGFGTDETVETGEDGSYLFRVSPEEDYTITPTSDDYSFSPSSVSYEDVTRDRTTNFEAEAD